MSKKNILTIIPKNVVAQVIDSNLDDPIIEQKAYSWNKDGLGTTLEVVVANYPDNAKFRMLVDDEFCHIAGFEIEKKYSGNRNYIKKIASNIIPEDLDEVEWDYSEISTSAGLIRIQVFAFSLVLQSEFNKISGSIKAKIELVLPISLTLLESIAEKDESFLIIYSDKISNIIVATQDGIAKIALNFTKENLSKKIIEIMNYLSEYLKYIPTQVVVNSSIPKQVVSLFEKDYKVIRTEISVSANITDVSAISGSDKKVLNISFAQKKSSLEFLEEEVKKSQFKSDGGNLLFFLIIFLVGLAGIVFGYFFVRYYLLTKQ